MQKHKSFHNLKVGLAAYRETPFKGKVLLPLKLLLSFVAFSLCLLGLVTSLPSQIANPTAFLLIAVVYLFSAIEAFRTSKLVSRLYLIAFVATLLLAIGGLVPLIHDYYAAKA